MRDLPCHRAGGRQAVERGDQVRRVPDAAVTRLAELDADRGRRGYVPAGEFATGSFALEDPTDAEVERRRNLR